MSTKWDILAFNTVVVGNRTSSFALFLILLPIATTQQVVLSTKS